MDSDKIKEMLSSVKSVGIAGYFKSQQTLVVPVMQAVHDWHSSEDWDPVVVVNALLPGHATQSPPVEPSL